MERVAEAEPEGRLLAEFERHAELVKDGVAERHWVGVGDREKVGLGEVHGEAVSDGVMVSVAVEEVEGVAALDTRAESEGDAESEPPARVSVEDTVSQREGDGEPEAEVARDSECVLECEGDAEEEREAPPPARRASPPLSSLCGGDSGGSAATSES